MIDFKDIAKEFLLMVSKRLDVHTTEKGFVEISVDKVTLFTPSHVQYAAYGRAPGKKPPLDPILKWVSQKGILIKGSDERGTAFAIQNSISKKGTKNYKPNAPNVLEEAIKSEIDNYSRELSKLFFIEISKEVDKLVNEKGFIQTKIKI